MSLPRRAFMTGDRCKVIGSDHPRYGSVGTILDELHIDAGYRMVFEERDGWGTDWVPNDDRYLRFISQSKELREDIIAMGRSRANNYGYDLKPIRDEAGTIIAYAITFEGEEVSRLEQADIMGQKNRNRYVLDWMRSEINKLEKGPDVGRPRRS